MIDTELDVQHYYKLLLEKALEDDFISSDEQAMLDTITHQFEKYNEILAIALEDGVISLREKVELYKFRTSIFGEALKTACKQDDVSDAEAKLLNVLIQILSEFGKYEDLYKEDNKLTDTYR